MKRIALLIIAVLLFATCAIAQHASAVAPSPAFDKLKTLQGEWVGKMIDGGKEYPATTSFRMVSDGSVLMNVLGAGTPWEMVTMFHMNGKEVLLTHYCAAHNQPRMRLVPGSDPNVLAFEFKDATNLESPAVSHMDHVKFTFIDNDHHIEEWTSVENGKETTGRFEFTRKK